MDANIQRDLDALATTVKILTEHVYALQQRVAVLEGAQHEDCPDTPAHRALIGAASIPNRQED